MSNLPLVFDDKENSPDLEAFFQQFGLEKYISAPEFNKMRDAVNELYYAGGSISGNSLISVGNNGEFDREGQNIIVPLGTKWMLNFNIYNLSEDYPVYIPVESGGLHRFDRIVGNDQGIPERIPGTPHENSPFIPSVPVGKIPITVVPIYGDIIGIPEQPIIGNQFISKESEKVNNIAITHTPYAVSLDSNARTFRITEAVENAVIAGFADASLWGGADVWLWNDTDEDIEILHDSGLGIVDFPAYFSDTEDDFVLKAKHKVHFKEDAANGRYEFFGMDSVLPITAGKIADGAITTNKIADEAITQYKLAAQAVSQGKIASNAVTSGKLATGAVTTAKIQGFAVTADKLASASVTNAKIQENAINTGKIQNGAVTPEKLSFNPVPVMTWNPANPLVITNYWYSVCYGNGKFLAVSGGGFSGTIWSNDGINWNYSSGGGGGGDQRVCYGNGKFVAIKNAGNPNRAMWSNDGINWNPSSGTEVNSWYSVCYGNGKFVAVANSGTNRVMWSNDGINWNPASAAEANSWCSVCYGNGKFVAVANSGTNRVMWSNDGINWNPASAAEANSWYSVCYGNGKFVAVSLNGTNRVMWSNDGINWNPASAAEANQWTSVCYGDGKFVAISIGGTNKVMYSFDENFTSELINDGDGESPFITEAKADSKLSYKADTSDLADVALSGSYDDLTGKPNLSNAIKEIDVLLTGAQLIDLHNTYIDTPIYPDPHEHIFLVQDASEIIAEINSGTDFPTGGRLLVRDTHSTPFDIASYPFPENTPSFHYVNKFGGNLNIKPAKKLAFAANPDLPIILNNPSDVTVKVRLRYIISDFKL